MKNRRFLPDNNNPCLLLVLLSGLIGGEFLIIVFLRAADSPLTHSAASTSPLATTPIQLRAILHYATSPVVPQQTLDEITLSFDVLRSLSPCNFLVFGLGHDSLMWASFNPRGNTLFLEEDPRWIQSILKNAPDLQAHTVNYRTKLSESKALLKSYKSEPDCFPPDKAFLKNNDKCRLALSGLPNEVYDKEWDMIMIDAPRGWFAEAPGRMAAIYSAAVMARKRKGSGVTHVFLHDVDRRVEKAYAKEFLCRKYLVKGVGRLWHFEIPPAANVSGEGRESAGFC
ncbi:arabinogalactan O-methyltransferase 1-like [Rhododendron vialii]|uniref:arabinogalactan O-methyltransferase 1-like n=1 Tax=Rhododendron vialii TaxID=182163 RepID=UPI00265FF1A0|nr:arabinogalactan O-methyltransferase 1-like [Rhododendron vialii]